MFFVDYGNEEVLSINDKEKNLCEIAVEFKKYPAMGLKCSLKDIELTNKKGVVDLIFLALSGLVFVRFIGYCQDFYYVDVTFEQNCDNGDIKLIKLNDYLISNDYAKPKKMDDQPKTLG